MDAEQAPTTSFTNRRRVPPPPTHHQAAEGILAVTRIELGEIVLDVIRKDIKNVHLSVYPP